MASSKLLGSPEVRFTYPSMSLYCLGYILQFWSLVFIHYTCRVVCIHGSWRSSWSVWCRCAWISFGIAHIRSGIDAQCLILSDTVRVSTCEELVDADYPVGTVDTCRGDHRRKSRTCLCVVNLVWHHGFVTYEAIQATCFLQFATRFCWSSLRWDPHGHGFACHRRDVV
jgi:hypothetical protein